jgi:hypothetical protein
MGLIDFLVVRITELNGACHVDCLAPSMMMASKGSHRI